MLFRFLVSKIGLFVGLVWLADQLSVPVPTDIYTLFGFEVLVLAVMIPLISVWKSFR
jgi:hypothetical protein